MKSLFLYNTTKTVKRHWKSRLFWAPNHGTRRTARCHFTGPKKVSISRAQPPPTCPCNVSARIKSITNGVV